MIPKSAVNPYIICGDIPGKPLVYLDAMWRRIRKRTDTRRLSNARQLGCQHWLAGFLA
jgi:hypothetical protein